MKQATVIGLVLASITASTSAHELSNSNLVERSLTLKDSEMVFAGGVYHGDSKRENETGVGLAVGYGISDNFTVGFSGLRYRFLARPNEGSGLELTVGAGGKGLLEQNNQDVEGYGADITGKYVVSKHLAYVFSAEYVFWNKPGSDNASENRYSVGALYQPIDKVTFSIDYTYRDLKDFTQSSAYGASTGVHYALNKKTDVGLTFEYSDFDAVKNGYDADSAYQRVLGGYVSYRF